MATAAQKAQQQRFALAAKQARREGRKGKSFAKRVGELLKGRGSPGAGHKTTSAKRSGGQRSTAASGGGGSTSKGGRVGVVYQSASSGLAVLAPATDTVIELAEAHQRPGVADLMTVKDKVWSIDYAENLAVEAATVAVDKRFGQAGALSRGSVTALAAEAFLGIASGNNARQGNVRSGHAKWSLTRNGYDPAAGAWYATPELVTYRVLKHGGQVVRKLRTRSAERGGIISRLLEPIGANILRPLGLTW